MRAWDGGDLRLPTPWSHEVSPEQVRREHPRPQLRRDRWLSLDGLWQFAAAGADEPPPCGVDLAERVLVPFPLESDLSGVRRHEDRCWYRRTVTVPPEWGVGEGARLLLHFGAVDHRARVWVDGTLVVEHAGGYGRFGADVTHALVGDGPHEIVVGVEDLAEVTGQPLGKQRLVPDRHIMYTGATGIWQTVWLEPVPPTHVARLLLTPGIDPPSLTAQVTLGGDAVAVTAVTAVTVEVVVRDDDGREVGRSSGLADTAIRVPVPDARLWSPDDPYLHAVEVTLRDDAGVAVDRVTSYAGLREVAVAPGPDGRPRITLNGAPVFVLATLDQGYWPDGIYTAPTDAALASDLEAHVRLGFNAVRKHLKVEPDRWYHHADRLGLLVWQDVPSMPWEHRPTPEAQQQFEREVAELVEQHRGWTSVIGWVPFNEGWGEWDRAATGRIAADVARLDPTRLVDAHSGVNCVDSLGDSGAGHVVDHHEYTGPALVPPDATRAAVDGEHGGFGLEVAGHLWFEDGGGYRMAATPEELTELYVENTRALADGAARLGMSGAVYTQLSDVEHEVNGLLTYDRQVVKVDVERVRAVNRDVIGRRSTW